MFIKDLHDEMINISDFESITIEYVSYEGNNAHHIVGKYTIHTSQMLSGYEINISASFCLENRQRWHMKI